MTTTETRPVERPLYAPGTYPKKTGFFGLSLRASLFGGVGLVIVILTMMLAGILSALVLAMFFALLLAPMVIRFERRSLYEVMQLKIQWWKRRASGSTVYRSGPNSRVPGGRYRLPGIFAATTLHVGTDRLGNEFGMIHRRRGDEYSVVFECYPGGAIGNYHGQVPR